MDEKLFMDEIGHIFPSNLNKEEKVEYILGQKNYIKFCN
ncbi:hypothetical protein HMPREF1229_1578 [Streptococcus pyogenes GA40634]|nr:hypothetical protein HMPREF1229_1578 [Streptococcus pyogenes GA40634]